VDGRAAGAPRHPNRNVQPWSSFFEHQGWTCARRARTFSCGRRFSTT